MTKYDVTEAWILNVLDAMRRRGISRAKVAKACGMRDSDISKLLEMRKISETSKFVEVVSRFLNIPLPITNDPDLDLLLFIARHLWERATEEERKIMLEGAKTAYYPDEVQIRAEHVRRREHERAERDTSGKSEEGDGEEAEEERPSLFSVLGRRQPPKAPLLVRSVRGSAQSTQDLFPEEDPIDKVIVSEEDLVRDAARAPADCKKPTKL